MKFRIGILLILTQIFLQVSGQDKYFREYSKEAGLNNTFIYALNQDNEGYLWVGTAEGLYSFNGFDFQYFTDKDSLAENFITHIYKDISGDLWVGHMGGGITHITDNTFNIISETSTNTSSITSIAETETGAIWFSTQDDGLLVLNPGERIVKLPNPIENELIMSFRHVSGNIFLLGTQENLYIAKYKVDSGIFEKIVRVSDYPSSTVVDIVRDNIGEFLILSQDEGIFSLSIDPEPVSYKLEVICNNDNSELDGIQGALFIDENELWVYAMGEGIIIFNRESETSGFLLSETINTNKGLISNDIHCMFKDMEENIWLGMYGDGLLRLVDDNLKFYSYRNTIENNQIYSISADRSSIWISSNNSISSISPEDGLIRKTYPFPVSLNGAKINSIYCSKGGIIYIGFEKAGVYTFNYRNEKYSKLFFSQDDLENSINYITGKGSTIWIATKKGVCKYNALTGDKKRFRTNDGLPHNNIQQLYIDSKDRVLIGTMCHSIFYIDSDNSIEVLPNATNMGRNLVISFAEDMQGNIWVATKGSGVYKFSDEGILNYRQSSGLLSDYCYSMVFDGVKNILVTFSGGFSNIDTESSQIKNFSQYEGINSSSEFYQNSVFVDKINNIWFGTSEGIIKYLPQITDKGLTPPILHIDAVYLNNQKVRFAENIRVKSGFYKIEIEYTGIKLNNPEMVSYQTVLDGYSSSWSDVTNNRRVIYERVGHGEYIFKVKAFNENGVSIKYPLALAIKINKPFYISWWFILSCISILVLLIASYIKLREKTLKKEKTVLEEKVKERTDEVIQKSLIIEEKNKDITSSLRYAERIQRAMLPKPGALDDTFVLYMPKDIVSGDFYWMYSNREVLIIAAVDCTGHGVPGAFMSIIGHNSLNRVVNEQGVTKPATILEKLNIEVNRQIVRSEEIGITDGMDISLVTYNKKNLSMEFAGAYSPLYVVREGELSIYRGDSCSIDMMSLNNKTKFTNKMIDVRTGDMVYLFSDGYADQFGGEYSKKFKSANLRKILSEVWNLPVK